MIVLQIIIIYLFSDLVTGFFHFLLDQYGHPKSRFFKNAIAINLIHHEQPRALLQRSYWELTKDSWKIAFVVFPILTVIVGFQWQLLLFFLIAGNTNIIHKWSHANKSEKHVIVHYLQKMKIIQGKHHHRLHHKKPFDTYFCITTNFWNPILEKIYFWEGLIRMFKFFGINPVAGSSVRNNV